MADPTRSRSRSAAPLTSDMSSLSRIGEALLLAQTRARASTERANRSERILRSVLSQINLQSGVLLHELEDYPRSLSFDAMADWDLVQELIEHSGGAVDTRRYPAADTEHATFALSMAEVRGAPHTLSSLPHADDAEDLRVVTRDVVMNLHFAARTAERRIEKMNGAISWRQGWGLARWFPTEMYYYFRPWQLMAGVVIGFALGVATTRRLLLEKALAASATTQPSVFLSDQQQLVVPTGVTPSTCRGDAVTNRQITKFHLAASRLPVTFAMEDMTHLLHTPAEVTS